MTMNEIINENQIEMKTAMEFKKMSMDEMENKAENGNWTKLECISKCK